MSKKNLEMQRYWVGRKVRASHRSLSHAKRLRIALKAPAHAPAYLF